MQSGCALKRVAKTGDKPTKPLWPSGLFILTQFGERNVGDKENFLWAMRLLDAILDGVVYGEDLARFTGIDESICDIIISDYYKLSTIRNAK